MKISLLPMKRFFNVQSWGRLYLKMGYRCKIGEAQAPRGRCLRGDGGGHFFLVIQSGWRASLYRGDALRDKGVLC